MSNTGYIAAITRGHNAGVCLLKDGEIVFAIEEERFSRHKYDGGPYASMVKILEYTDKIDYLVVAHTQSLAETAGRVDFTGDDVYTGLARKLGLISRKENPYEHPQVVDLSHMHHRLHVACAFYRSGFETAAGVIIDGAGTFIPLSMNNEETTGWETETLYSCAYPNDLNTIWKHIGIRGPAIGGEVEAVDEMGGKYPAFVNERAGLVKAYEAVTEYCGFSAIEAGKTMGLFPYGKENDGIPKIYDRTSVIPLVNRNLIIPTYPNSGKVNSLSFDALKQNPDENEDPTKMQNRRDMAYAVQTQTQQRALELILQAVEMTGEKNVVVSGGYGLNCVANYFYLDKLKDMGINLYVEPISNDAGTAIGAALMFHRSLTQDESVLERSDDLYLGPKYNIDTKDVYAISKQYKADVTDATNEDVIKLITDKNIVAVYQGRSENGPRALGNRSILYDPTDPNGKEHVNMVKRREYFRPFAGSILEEDVHEWFDLRGMESSPTMMYAVNCQPGIEEKIPAIIHVDGTCRIQTVNREQNENYYDLIKAFKDATGCPIIFNTSFNLGGEPLVETLEDALWTLQQSDIEYLYLPEHNKLLTILND